MRGSTRAGCTTTSRRAVAEDLPGEDVTSVATLDPTAGRARRTSWPARAGVVAGLPVAEVVFRHVVGAAAARSSRGAADGDRVQRGDVLLSVHRTGDRRC